MKRVAICFSGHPRTFLNNITDWKNYFALIRGNYKLSIFFHCWAEQGNVVMSGSTSLEGKLESGNYAKFNELLDCVQPDAFSIESLSPELMKKNEGFPPVLLSSWQAGRAKILSQLYSVHRSDFLRQSFEISNSLRFDVVIRLRFDLKPVNFTLNEIRYVIEHPNVEVLFAPSPAWHIHPGGGGGCRDCHAFFDANWLNGDFAGRAEQFLRSHTRHTNDICDLFAIGNATIMARYTSIYTNAEQLQAQLMDAFTSLGKDDYELEADFEDVRDDRIRGTKTVPWDIESSAAFTPEKLIRLKMQGTLVVHGESIFVISRRQG